MTGRWTVEDGVPVWTDHHGRVWSLGDDRLLDVWPAMDGVDVDRALTALAGTIDALATLVYAIRDLHCEVPNRWGGDCVTCCLPWPCSTRQVADELAAEAS